MVLTIPQNYSPAFIRFLWKLKKNMKDSHNKVSQTLKSDFCLYLSTYCYYVFRSSSVCCAGRGLPPPPPSSPSLSDLMFRVLEAGMKLYAVYWASLHLQTWYCWMGFWINESLCSAEGNYRHCKWLWCGSYHGHVYCYWLWNYSFNALLLY